MIAVFAIVPKSPFSLMRESFHLKLLKTIIYSSYPCRYLSPSDSQDHGPYNSNKPATPMFIWNATNWPMGVHDYDPRNKFPIFRTNLIVYDRSFESSHAKPGLLSL